jgi:hypothetical protein
MLFKTLARLRIMLHQVFSLMKDGEMFSFLHRMCGASQVAEVYDEVQRVPDALCVT